MEYPILSYREVVRPISQPGKTDVPSPHTLFHYFSKDWGADFARAGANGAAQAALSRLEEYCGFKGAGRTLRSPRSWSATCATQLAFKREDRVALGRWSAGPVMPGRYGRGICVAELRLRDEILCQVNDGRLPQRAFEIPSTRVARSKDKPTESDSDTTSVTSTAPHLRPEIGISDMGGFVEKR